jgi:DNA-binding NarL/FixJ family response regulator
VTVVLSTSTAEHDVAKAFELGADAYMPKFPPVSEIKTIFQLANAMQSIEEIERTLWPGLHPSGFMEPVAGGKRSAAPAYSSR